MKKIGFLKMVFSLTALCTAVSAQSTTMQFVSLEEMSKKADAIVQGKIESVESKWNEQHTVIYTYTKVSVSDWLKTSEDKTELITIRQRGGTADGITQMTIGDAKFTAGEEVVLFLAHESVKKNDGYYFLLAMSQTKFTIIDDPQIGKTVKRDIKGVSFIDKPATDATEIQRVDSNSAPFLLTEFVSKIRAYISANQPQKENQGQKQ